MPEKPETKKETPKIPTGISKEWLQDKCAALKLQLKQAEANCQALGGAVQLCEQMIAEAVGLEMAAAAAKKEPEQNEKKS